MKQSRRPIETRAKEQLRLANLTTLNTTIPFERHLRIHNQFFNNEKNIKIVHKQTSTSKLVFLENIVPTTETKSQ